MSHLHSSLPRVPEAESPLSPQDRRALLQVAYDAITGALSGTPIDLTPPSSRLAEKRGAFTTLHRHGELRGCVGYVFPVSPLYQTVAETATGAAFNDTRFPPLEASELPDLAIEISVLSPLRTVRPEEVQVGIHGLLVTMGFRRGLLLPQVAVEHHWNPETFLQQTCVKAGLAPDAWKRGAEIMAFTAEIFGSETFA